MVYNLEHTVRVYGIKQDRRLTSQDRVQEFYFNFQRFFNFVLNSVIVSYNLFKEQISTLNNK